MRKFNIIYIHNIPSSKSETLLVAATEIDASTVMTPCSLNRPLYKIATAHPYDLKKSKRKMWNC